MDMLLELELPSSPPVVPLKTLTCGLLPGPVLGGFDDDDDAEDEAACDDGLA
jgi:hypothetical protein